MAELKTKKSDLEIVEDLSKTLFELAGVDAKVKVSEDLENDAISVDIESKEAGLLIGSRGSTLNSIQVVLGMLAKNAIGKWRRIIVNVADWREKEKDRLVMLARTAAERAKSTGLPQNLYNLTPAQRRIVHLTLSQDAGVVTQSQGEGKDRYLVVSPKLKGK